ncbi:MAG: GHKL domain-containing protein [Lachnospiraceae bacterium]|nr:GHKL domain-containing protein [Lachnospiraceae bacterium]
MVIRTIEMLTEYICLIICIHKIAKKKVEFSLGMLFPFIVEWTYVLVSNVAKIPIECKLLIFCGIFFYTRIKIVKSWNKTINICGSVFIIVMFLQVLQYYLLKLLTKELFITQYEGVVLNINICLLLLFWKEKYSNIIVAKLNKIKGAIIVIAFFVILIRILFLLSSDAYAAFEVAIQFLFASLGLSVACILWISAENEKNHKARELQMYELYNKAFEETIVTIRTRQHEFENHINAIKCLHYMIDDYGELLAAQEQYCEKVLKENKLNKLFKVNLEPVLIGFLYSKFTFAEEKEIVVKYEIQSVDVKEKIEIYEFIEIMGILFDNAVEAMEDKKNRIIILKFLRDSEQKSFYIEIANSSVVYSNSEIEKFCSYGYSTKGEKRGIGLARVKEIAQKYDAIFQIQNCVYEGNNYLSFKLTFI